MKMGGKGEKVGKEGLGCMVKGLGKDGGEMMWGMKGFRYVESELEQYRGEVKVVGEMGQRDGGGGKVKWQGGEDVGEGVGMMWKEGVEVWMRGKCRKGRGLEEGVGGSQKKEGVVGGKGYL